MLRNVNRLYLANVEQDSDIKDEIVQLVKFGLGEQLNDFRMYVSRLIRKYRVGDASFSKALESLLQSSDVPDMTPIRELGHASRRTGEAPILPVGQRSDVEKPFLPERIVKQVEGLLEERENASVLALNGLSPTSTAIFTGPPGVGKTMTARWIASQLGMPMYRLDLAETIGRHLGESGNNIKAAFSKVRVTPGILFLDEIDAIAKTRSDDSDIGEMKRVVTVLLQELDDRNPASLILAATNNMSLIDPAVWRRFELRIDFPMPDEKQIMNALESDFSASDSLGGVSAPWIEALGIVMKGAPFSEVRSVAMRIRKRCVLRRCPAEDAITEYIRENTEGLTHAQRISLAVALVETGAVTQRLASEMTGVSRQTIRRRTEKTNSKG